MTYFIYLSLLLLTTIKVIGQEYLTIHFQDDLVNLKEPPSRFVVFIYKYKSDTVFYSGAPYLVKPPLKYSRNTSAFGFLQFEEHNWKSIPSHGLFFIDNYSSEFQSIYFDTNFNLDFTDDIQMSLNNQNVEVEFLDKSNKNIKVRIELSKIVFKDKAQEDRAESFANHNIPISIKNHLLPARYWMTELRYNYKSSRDYDDIGLMDFNNNGRFNDLKYDKILVSDTIGKKVNDRNNIYRYDLGTDSIINFRGVKYIVTQIDPLGRQLTLQQAKDQSIGSVRILLGNGIPMPNFEFDTFDNLKVAWDKIRPRDKFILIDFWGTWCKPCLAQTNDLINLKNRYSEKLEILGLAYQENKQKAIEYTKSKNLNWIQGFANEKIVNEFQILNFPYYILVDKNGIIKSVNSSLDDIEKLIK